MAQTSSIRLADADAAALLKSCRTSGSARAASYVAPKHPQAIRSEKNGRSFRSPGIRGGRAKDETAKPVSVQGIGQRKVAGLISRGHRNRPGRYQARPRLVLLAR